MLAKRHNKALVCAAQLDRYETSTDIYTNNEVRYKVLKFIFTNLDINHYDKPTAPENLLDYIDARRPCEIGKLNHGNHGVSQLEIA